MLGRSVGLVAASALGASAFLIPAGVQPPHPSEPGLGLWDHAIEYTKSWVVRLPCSACAFKYDGAETEDSVEHEDTFWAQGGAHSLILNFTLSEDGTKLDLNGEPIFPIRAGPAVFDTPRIHAAQVPASASWQDINNGDVRNVDLQVTGFGTGVAKVVPLDDEAVMTRLRYVIFGLEGIPIELNAVLVDLVQAESGQLQILAAEIEKAQPLGRLRPSFPKGFYIPDEPAEHEIDEPDRSWDLDVESPPKGPGRFNGLPHMSFRPPHGHAPPADCKSLPAPLCRFKQAIEAKIGGFKKGGCHGRMGGKPNHRPWKGALPTHIKPHFLRPDFDAQDADVDRPFGHRGPHGSHRHGHHGHRHGFHLLHALARGISTVLIPTLAGVAVGMTAGVLGLAVGRLISYLWIRLFRGGHRGYNSVSLDEEHEEEQKIVSFPIYEIHTEPLPAYEDSPAYVEVEKESRQL